MKELIEKILSKDFNSAENFFKEEMKKIAADKLDEMKKAVATTYNKDKATEAKNLALKKRTGLVVRKGNVKRVLKKNISDKDVQAVEEAVVHSDGLVHLTTGEKVLPSVYRARRWLTEGNMDPGFGKMRSNPGSNMDPGFGKMRSNIFIDSRDYEKWKNENPIPKELKDKWPKDSRDYEKWKNENPISRKMINAIPKDRNAVLYKESNEWSDWMADTYHDLKDHKDKNVKHHLRMAMAQHKKGNVEDAHEHMVAAQKAASKAKKIEEGMSVNDILKAPAPIKGQIDARTNKEIPVGNAPAPKPTPAPMPAPAPAPAPKPTPAPAPTPAPTPPNIKPPSGEFPWPKSGPKNMPPPDKNYPSLPNIKPPSGIYPWPKDLLPKPGRPGTEDKLPPSGKFPGRPGETDIPKTNPKLPFDLHKDNPERWRGTNIPKTNPKLPFDLHKDKPGGTRTLEWRSDRDGSTGPGIATIPGKADRLENLRRLRDKHGWALAIHGDYDSKFEKGSIPKNHSLYENAEEDIVSIGKSFAQRLKAAAKAGVPEAPEISDKIDSASKDFESNVPKAMSAAKEMLSHLRKKIEPKKN